MSSEVALVSSSEEGESTESPWCGLFEVMYNIDPSEDSNSPLVKCKEFSDSIYNTFEDFRKSRKYKIMVAVSILDKLVKDNYEHWICINN